MFYYGVLSAKVKLDVLAEPYLANLRRRLGVKHVHAAEL